MASRFRVSPSVGGRPHVRERSSPSAHAHTHSSTHAEAHRARNIERSSAHSSESSDDDDSYTPSEAPATLAPCCRVTSGRGITAGVLLVCVCISVCSGALAGFFAGALYVYEIAHTHGAPRMYTSDGSANIVRDTVRGLTGRQAEAEAGEALRKGPGAGKSDRDAHALAPGVVTAGRSGAKLGSDPVPRSQRALRASAAVDRLNAAKGGPKAAPAKGSIVKTPAMKPRDASHWGAPSLPGSPATHPSSTRFSNRKAADADDANTGTTMTQQRAAAGVMCRPIPWRIAPERFPDAKWTPVAMGGTTDEPPCFWAQLKHAQAKITHSVCTFDPKQDQAMSHPIHQYGGWTSEAEMLAFKAASACSDERPFALHLGAGAGFVASISAATGCFVIAIESHLSRIRYGMATMKALGAQDRTVWYQNAISNELSTMYAITSADNNPSADFVNTRPLSEEGVALQERVPALPLDTFFAQPQLPQHPVTHKPMRLQDVQYIELSLAGFNAQALHQLRGDLERLPEDERVPYIHVELTSTGVDADCCSYPELLRAMRSMGYVAFEGSEHVACSDAFWDGLLTPKLEQAVSVWFVSRRVFRTGGSYRPAYPFTAADEYAWPE